MIECEHLGRLSAYLDGELDAATGAMLEQHLRGCTSCAAELARIRRLSELLGSLPEPDLSAEARRRLHKAVDAAFSDSVRRLAMALTAAAAAVLLICTLWLWKLPEAAPSPAGPMPTWEATALQRPSEPPVASSEDQIATWIVQDLSRENGHD